MFWCPWKIYSKCLGGFLGETTKYSLLANLRKTKPLILVSCWQFFVMLRYERVQRWWVRFCKWGVRKMGIVFLEIEENKLRHRNRLKQTCFQKYWLHKKKKKWREHRFCISGLQNLLKTVEGWDKVFLSWYGLVWKKKCFASRNC